MIHTSTTMATLPMFGLRNVGNTCYMNALVQFMVSFRSVVDYLDKEVDMGTSEHTKRQIKILLQIARTKHGQFAFPVMNILPFVQGLQQCAAQSMFAVVGIPDCVNMGFTYLTDMWKIQSLFGCQFRTRILCQNCKHAITRDDPMQPQVFISHGDTRPFLHQATRSPIEKLKDYKCDSCGEIGHCIRSSTLTTVPRIMVVTFHSNYNPANIPTYFVVENGTSHHTFHIRSVISLSRGHYTSTCMRTVDGRDAIVHCNDHMCILQQSFEPSLQCCRMVGFEQQ